MIISSPAYQQRCQQVLRRAGWRCQNCSGQANLHVHHIQLRSHLGDDTEQNLITVCSESHQQIHSR